MVVSEKSDHPVGGEDYLRTLVEVDERFASEAACEDFLRRLRWPEGFYCPGCGAAGAWETSRGLFRCSSCARQTSVTAGTLFEGHARTPTPVVPSDVVFHEPETRGECPGAATHPGSGKLPDGLGMGSTA